VNPWNKIHSVDNERITVMVAQYMVNMTIQNIGEMKKQVLNSVTQITWICRIQNMGYYT